MLCAVGQIKKLKVVAVWGLATGNCSHCLGKMGLAVVVRGRTVKRHDDRCSWKIGYWHFSECWDKREARVLAIIVQTV